RRAGLRAMVRHAVSAALLLGMAIAPGPSAAQDAGAPGLGETIPGHGPTTYLDLMRLVVTDLARDGNGYAGRTLAPVRTLDADVQAAEPPAQIGITGVETIGPGGQGGDEVLLLADFGGNVGSAEGYAVLGLFDLSGVPRLRDAVNVAHDRFTSFNQPAVLAVAEGATLVLSRSSHFNSNQSYVTTALLLVRDGRIEPVDTVFTFDETGCDFERRQALSFAAKGASGSRPADFDVTVTETTRPAADPCGDGPVPAASTRTIAVTYAWNTAEGRYQPSSDALLQLAAENAERF
ncbi:MAG: hypothetical protein KF914_20150, partial [Rhizobiaceae bacterium]|nr:hypothetical protein [Rhizobiaceae bacterium]